MSEPENFLSRWSRRKLEAEVDPPEPSAPMAPASVAPPDAPADGEGDAPSLDADAIAALPPLETIGADTDVTAFLRAGVPGDLSRAALRRAWSSDPAIRDFVGLIENGWDFNDPGSIPGFGPLEMTDELQRIVAKIMDVSDLGPKPPPGEDDERIAGATPPDDALEPPSDPQNAVESVTLSEVADLSAVDAGTSEPTTLASLSDPIAIRLAPDRVDDDPVEPVLVLPMANPAPLEPERSPLPRSHGRALPK